MFYLLKNPIINWVEFEFLRSVDQVQREEVFTSFILQSCSSLLHIIWIQSTSTFKEAIQVAHHSLSKALIGYLIYMRKCGASCEAWSATVSSATVVSTAVQCHRSSSWHGTRQATTLLKLKLQLLRPITQNPLWTTHTRTHASTNTRARVQTQTPPPLPPTKTTTSKVCSMIFSWKELTETNCKHLCSIPKTKGWIRLLQLIVQNLLPATCYLASAALHRISLLLLCPEGLIINFNADWPARLSRVSDRELYKL